MGTLWRLWVDEATLRLLRWPSFLTSWSPTLPAWDELVVLAEACKVPFVCLLTLVIASSLWTGLKHWLTWRWGKETKREEPRGRLQRFESDDDSCTDDDEGSGGIMRQNSSTSVLNSMPRTPLLDPFDINKAEESETAKVIASFGEEGAMLTSQLLDFCPFFACLRPAPLQTLLRGLETVALAEGEQLFSQGDARDAFLVVRRGKVRLNLARSAGSVDYCAGDQVVGLVFVLAALDKPSMHASEAKAMTADTEVFKLPLAVLRHMFDVHPNAMADLARLLVLRLVRGVYHSLRSHFGLTEELVAHTIDEDRTGHLCVDKTSPATALADALGISEDGEEERSADAWSVLQDHARLVEVAPGDYVFPPGDKSGDLYVLLDGVVSAEVPRSTAGMPQDEPVGNKVAFKVLPGELLGELSALSGLRSPVSYKAECACVLAALPEEQLPSILASQPKACFRLLGSVASKAHECLHRIDAALDWVRVRCGETVLKKGTLAEEFFVVLHGRLVQMGDPARDGGSGASSSSGGGMSRASGGASTQQRSIVRGDLVGAAECLASRCHEQDVVAARDCEVCRVSKTLLRIVALEFPSSLLTFATRLAAGSRSQETTGTAGGALRTQKTARTGTIALCAADPSVLLFEACERLKAAMGPLASTAHVRPSFLERWGLDSKLRRPPKEGIDDDDRAGLWVPRLTQALGELEDRHQHVLFECDPQGFTEWTKLCVRNADLVLVVCWADSKVDTRGALNSYVRALQGPVAAKVGLLILHRDSREDHRLRTMAVAATDMTDLVGPGLVDFLREGMMRARRKTQPISTRHLLHSLPAGSHGYHVRFGRGLDWDRLARMLCGKAFALILGGGGAKGIAHFGVIKALHEHGVPIDMIGGTSFGSLVAAMYAMCIDQDTMLRKAQRLFRKYFSQSALLRDLTLPITSYFTGWLLNDLLQRAFKRVHIEDLWIPFFCTSTDIVRFSEVIHSQGLLWRYVRASMSLVGFVPPLPEDEGTLLVDGGYTNNFPITHALSLGAGTVIVVDVSGSFGALDVAYGDTLSGSSQLMRRYFSCCRRRASCKAPPPTLSDVQERLMFLSDLSKQDLKCADLVLVPPVQGFGLLEFTKFHEIVEVGYRYAGPEVKRWRNDTDVGRRMSAIVERAGLEGPLREWAAKEYGERGEYHHWRRFFHSAKQGIVNTQDSLKKSLEGDRQRLRTRLRGLRKQMSENPEKLRSGFQRLRRHMRKRNSSGDVMDSMSE